MPDRAAHQVGRVGTALRRSVLAQEVGWVTLVLRGRTGAEEHDISYSDS